MAMGVLVVQEEAEHHHLVVARAPLHNRGNQIQEAQLMLETLVYLEAMPLADQELELTLVAVVVELAQQDLEDRAEMDLFQQSQVRLLVTLAEVAEVLTQADLLVHTQQL
jgi:hypothetical protein